MLNKLRRLIEFNYQSYQQEKIFIKLIIPAQE